MKKTNDMKKVCETYGINMEKCLEDIRSINKRLRTTCNLSDDKKQSIIGLIKNAEKIAKEKINETVN